MSLEFLSKNKEKLLVLHGKTQEDIDKDLEILKEWIVKQAHLPPSLLEDTNFLEICLIRNKYSIEKAKTKIENYCTFKSRNKYLLEEYVGNIEPLKENCFYHMIEPLTENLERIFFSKVNDEEKYDIARDLAISLTMRELTSRYDYSDGEIYIMDYTECSINFVKKGRINVFVDAMKLAFKGHSARVKEVHFINKWAYLIINFIKPFLPKKLQNRLFGHENFESIKDRMPKSLIPKDYGGDYKSFREIEQDWDTIFRENKGKLLYYYNTMSREDLRIDSVDIGIPGTFRNLKVD